MAGIDKALLRQLLLISGPWEISDYQLDLRKQRCDVWIGPQPERSGWFHRPKPSTVRTQQHVWQHVRFGLTRFFVHVTAPVTADLTRLPWTGDAGMPFSRLLAQQVFVMFNEGLPLQAICKLLNLSLNDVWKYRFAIDNGLVQSQTGEAAAPAAAAQRPQPAAVAAAPAAAPLAAVAAAAAPAATVNDVEAPRAGETAVPDVADPVWLQLANGELKLDIRVLSLKLMLTKVRSQLEVITDDEVRMLKLRDLHRYFVKNERVLAHELAQLNEGVTA